MRTRWRGTQESRRPLWEFRGRPPGGVQPWDCHGWRWYVHHCTVWDARRLPEARFPNARHVTIVELRDFLRMLALVHDEDEQARIAKLDAASRRHLGHDTQPEQWHFRGHAPPRAPALELVRHRQDAPRASAGERKAA